MPERIRRPITRQMWHKDPRVVEAAKAALADEQAPLEPAKQSVAVLKKIVVGQS
jgi:hypothetical protein